MGEKYNKSTGELIHMDLVKMATYPFLSQVREWIRQEGIDINEILYDDTYDRARHLGRPRTSDQPFP